MKPLFRKLSIVLALLILFGGIAFNAYLRQGKSPPQEKKNPSLVPGVRVMEVLNGPVPAGVSVQGRLAAYEKIDLYTEVTGTLQSTSQPFKVGSYFKKGAPIFVIDDEEARLNLYAQKSAFLNSITQLMPDLKIDYPESFSNWNSYLEDFEVESAIQTLPEPQNQQEKYFIAARNIFNQYYNIKSLESRLKKYTVNAPFSGVLTEALINTGAVARAGQKLGQLMNTGLYELETTVPLKYMEDLRVGQKVLLESTDLEYSWSGKVRRISNQIDPATQSVLLFVSVSGKHLKEGMYLKGSIQTAPIRDAFELPRRLVRDQQSVFIVQDSILHRQPIEIIRQKAETVVVRGLKNGMKVMNQSLPNAYNGMKVKIEKTDNSEKLSEITN